jgi:hypothetical protein
MGSVKSDYIKRQITLTRDKIKRLLLYIEIIPSSEHWSMLVHVVPGTCLQLSSGFGPIRRH